MTIVDAEPERVPVNLDRNATELGAWSHDIRNACAHPPVPAGLNTHPKERAPFARIASALTEYDRTKPGRTSANTQRLEVRWAGPIGPHVAGSLGALWNDSQNRFPPA